jgi:SAM-dependent methyltransferase
MSTGAAAGAALLPFPPVELRTLVGPVESWLFDNPSGDLVFPQVPPEGYESVLDLGCGCGRIARQLIQQRRRPRAYLGLDIHAGMVEWCRTNLAPHAPGFRFEHHDVHNPGFNPRGPRALVPLPAEDGTFTLAVAWSVFTHLLQDQAVHYLAEIARVLRPDGCLLSTWFLFDKRLFPMMQDFQNALFVNEQDPSNAVIFDGRWLVATAAQAGLKLVAARLPKTRGYQWQLVFAPLASRRREVPLPADTSPVGRSRKPPLLPAGAENLGR